MEAILGIGVALCAISVAFTVWNSYQSSRWEFRKRELEGEWARETIEKLLDRLQSRDLSEYASKQAHILMVQQNGQPTIPRVQQEPQSAGIPATYDDLVM